MDKVQKLKDILKIVNESITKQDFENNFKVILRAVQDFFQKANLKLGEIEGKFTSVVNGIKENYNRDMEALKTKVMAMCKDYVGTMIENHDRRMTDLEDTLEGKEAEITPRIAQISLDLARSEFLPLIMDKEAINKNLSEQGGLIADVLEGLPNGNKLKIKAIEGLQEIIEELRQSRTRTLGGGGFSKNAMDLHFIDDETPAGTVNGVNTDFTIAHIPSPTASLKVFVNGQKLKLTTDYTFTLSTKTITFVTAPPTGSILLVDYRK